MSEKERDRQRYGTKGRQAGRVIQRQVHASGSGLSNSRVQCADSCIFSEILASTCSLPQQFVHELFVFDLHLFIVDEELPEGRHMGSVQEVWQIVSAT